MYEILISSDLPHQQRVIDEANELSVKLTALNKFINGSTFFLSLDALEQKRMTRQSVSMELYWGVLAERINNF